VTPAVGVVGVAVGVVGVAVGVVGVADGVSGGVADGVADGVALGVGDAVVGLAVGWTAAPCLVSSSNLTADLPCTPKVYCAQICAG
jgi:hypothetical protein